MFARTVNGAVGGEADIATSALPLSSQLGFRPDEPQWKVALSRVGRIQLTLFDTGASKELLGADHCRRLSCSLAKGLRSHRELHSHRWRPALGYKNVETNIGANFYTSTAKGQECSFLGIDSIDKSFWLACIMSLTAGKRDGLLWSLAGEARCKKCVDGGR